MHAVQAAGLLRQVTGLLWVCVHWRPVAQRRLVSAAADARKAVEGVNRERKLAQTAAASSLGDAEERWLAVVAKNREIEAACEALEARAGAVQASLPQRCGP